jgi:hypothetical protein
MRNLLVLSVASLLFSSGAAANEIDDFTYLFSRTCMKNIYSPDALRNEMANSPVLEGAAADFFRGGSEGTAWAVNNGSAKYVVAFREDNICSVFAQRASVEEVTKNFVQNVGEAPPPLVAEERRSDGPNGGGLRTVSYAWTREEDQTELLFTLTTSSQSNPTVQAMASLAVVAK